MPTQHGSLKIFPYQDQLPMIVKRAEQIVEKDEQKSDGLI
jgi:hypothetical protein